jgi:hypothetical protein
MNIAILDMDSIAFAMGNPNKVLDSHGIPLRKDNKFVYEDKTHEQLAESCDFIMNKILTNCNCDLYIAYIKGNNTTKAKRLIDPNYKADRSTTRPSWWEFVRGYLVNNWGVISVNDIEVDDAVNITRLSLKDSYMVCIDSDLLGLEGKHFDWKKNNMVGEWITTSADEAQYKFWSDMICGTHNNTKGLPGKGIKYCEKIFDNGNMNVFNLRDITFNEFINYYGEELGIGEFYKNYKMTKILNKYEGFVIPEPIKFKKKEELREEKGIFD